MAAVVEFSRVNVSVQTDADGGTTVKPQQLMFYFFKAGIDSAAPPFEFYGLAEPRHLIDYAAEFEAFTNATPAEPIE